MQIWSSAFSSMTTQHWKRHGRVTRLAIPEILCEKTWNIIELSSRKVIALGLQTDEQEIMIAYFLQWKNSAEWDEQVANFKEFRDKLQSAEHFFDTLICGYQRLKWAPKVTKPTNEKKNKMSKVIHLHSDISYKMFPFLLDKMDVYLGECTDILLLYAS